MTARSAWDIHLDQFDGPLDLLLRLIDEQELDIYDIPIASITAQYLGYLERMPAIDLDAASGFLVMAATLLQIKARMLLPPTTPPPEEEEATDPRQELVAMLVEYRRARRAASWLEARAGQWARTMRGPARSEADALGPAEMPPLEPGAGYLPLIRAARRIGPRLRHEPPPISRDRFGVVKKIREWLKLLRQSPDPVKFLELVRSRVRSDIIATFLALLELVRLRRAIVAQSSDWGEIEVRRRERRELAHDGAIGDPGGDPVHSP